MERQYREMVKTRRLYKFEEDFFHYSPYRYVYVQLGVKTLRNIATVIWESENQKREDLPLIRFGKGLYEGTDKAEHYHYSWCDGEVIELAPTQRDLLTLIHELVHAMGYDHHDSNFVGKYIEMLNRYAGIPKKDLIKWMDKYNVSLPRKYKKKKPHVSAKRSNKKKK